MVTTTTDERRTLTVEQAARELGIGRTLAFQMARDGRLPVIRFGRRVLVARSTIERLLSCDSQTGIDDPQRTP
jgi:excisionase family DNA binding protein